MDMTHEQAAAREQAYNQGMDHPDRAWVLTFFDSWEPNPFYVGPPVRHPEDDYDEEDGPAAAVVVCSSEIPF